MIGNQVYWKKKLKYCTGIHNSTKSSLILTYVSFPNSNIISIFSFYNKPVLTNDISDYIYATTLMFLLTPLSPRFLDFILPLNGSRPSLPLYQTDYFVLDPVKYEVPILFHAYIVSPIPSTIIVAFDALYANLAIHACGMFLCVG